MKPRQTRSTTSDRRRERRFRISLPVTLGGTAGHTQDISASGIDVALPRDLAPRIEAGDLVRLEMVLEHANPDGPLKVECEGEVVRVEPRGYMVGIAARILAYRFGPATSPARGS